MLTTIAEGLKDKGHYVGDVSDDHQVRTEALCDMQGHWTPHYQYYKAPTIAQVHQRSVLWSLLISCGFKVELGPFAVDTWSLKRCHHRQQVTVTIPAGSAAQVKKNIEAKMASGDMPDAEGQPLIKALQRVMRRSPMLS